MAYDKTRLQWFYPAACTPPHRITDLLKILAIARSFETRQRITGKAQAAWNLELPALVGVKEAVGVSLLTGAHRWGAAVMVGKVMLPVIVWTRAEAWLLHDDPEAWEALLQSGNPLPAVVL